MLRCWLDITSYDIYSNLSAFLPRGFTPQLHPHWISKNLLIGCFFFKTRVSDTPECLSQKVCYVASEEWKGHQKGVRIQLTVIFLCLWSGNGVLITWKCSEWIGGLFKVYTDWPLGAILMEWTSWAFISLNMKKKYFLMLSFQYDIDVANAGFIYAVWPTAYVISTPLSIWVTEKVCEASHISGDYNCTKL